jgi:hypothetical protein
MALAWPRIKSLVLKGDSTMEPYPCVTILGLVTLAEYCPELEMLTLLFDASSLPPLTADSSGAISKALKKLNVLKSPICELEWVAAYLYDIFPRAEVEYDTSNLERFKERWKQVHDFMQAFSQSEQEYLTRYEESIPLICHGE